MTSSVSHNVLVGSTAGVSVNTMPLHDTSELRSSVVTSSTLQQYESSVDSFYSFCSHHKLPTHTSRDIDQSLSIFMESLYQNCIPGGKQKAANALFGIIRRFPHYKLELPNSRQALKGYQKLLPSIPHPPFTYPSCVAVACVMCKSGYFDMAVAILLMFHCYLRPGEMLQLKVKDIALPGDARLGQVSITAAAATTTTATDRIPFSALRIAKAKTGTNQFVTILDSHIHQLLQVLISSRSSDSLSSNGLLFNFSESVFRRVLRECLHTLQLDEFDPPLTPHSLRHGGTTYDHMYDNYSIEELKVRIRVTGMDGRRLLFLGVEGGVDGRVPGIVKI